MRLRTSGFVESIRRIKKPRQFAVTALVLMVMVVASSVAYVQGISMGSQLSVNFVTTSVTGSLNVNNPGSDSFWSGISGLQIPLSNSASYGGNTKSVTVKMANNGSYLFIFASWSDPTESRLAKTVIENSTYGGLFYANSTFFYEDRIVFWWSLDTSPGPNPCMQKSAYGHGEGEALQGETGNLWHWKAARTDSLGSVFGKLKYGNWTGKTGQTITPTNSYADNEYINTTGHYQLGPDQYPTSHVPGNFTILNGENNNPYNTFLVVAHGVHNNSTNTWNWVAARSLTTSPTLHNVQFSGTNTYYFAVGVWDGGPISIPAGTAHPTGWQYYGENEETKSISSWYTMTLSSSTDYTLYYIVGGVAAAAIVAGVAVFMLRRGRTPKMSTPAQPTSQN